MERKAMEIAETIITHFMLQTSDRLGKANLMCGVRRARPSHPERLQPLRLAAALVGTAVQPIESPDFLLADFY